ncbi:MAG: hypothetical protein ACK4M3_01115 [Pyrobaculum sp.]
MRLELVFIPMLFGLAVASMSFFKPVDMAKTDLTAVFLYWPEAYRWVEEKNFTLSHVVCRDRGVLEAPPGLAYRVLNMSCRFKP